MRYTDLSLWHATCDEELLPRPALPGPVDVDVAVVGAGFTGLWTAYYLKQLDPSLRVAIVERHIAGFGASGRNGGWVSALFPASRAKLASLPGSSRAGAIALTAHLRETVDEIGRVADKESIDCSYAKGGTIVFARSPSQVARAREQVAESRSWGDTEEDLRWLDAGEAQQHARAAGALGATYTPHCARIHPARLVRGLAASVERQGVDIYEQTTATGIGPRRVTTDRGEITADVVVRATEGYTPGLPGHEREVIPVYSLMVATEPLTEQLWDGIGLSSFPTFSDHRHLIIYGQRTADGRLAFGGRGAPYHFRSSIKPEFDRNETVFAALRATLLDLFPQLTGVAFTSAWGGPLGVPRDWTASVGLDRRTGVGWAGGYVGDGVSTTNL
ncbi:MAG TPA: FAD-binding oxidoreductase, partial [Pseudonocardiaceae bacterium]|nr:FAD-binding oxidoreductase [Pseudonocardiaceae bacterium]